MCLRPLTLYPQCNEAAVSGPPPGVTRLPFPPVQPGTVRGALLSVCANFFGGFPPANGGRPAPAVAVLSTSIWLGSLPDSIPTTRVFEIMSLYGHVIDIQVRACVGAQRRALPLTRWPEQHDASKRQAFVVYDSRRGAEEAFLEAGRRPHDGFVLKVRGE